MKGAVSIARVVAMPRTVGVANTPRGKRRRVEIDNVMVDGIVIVSLFSSDACSVCGTWERSVWEKKEKILPPKKVGDLNRNWRKSRHNLSLLSSERIVCFHIRFKSRVLPSSQVRFQSHLGGPTRNREERTFCSFLTC